MIVEDKEIGWVGRGLMIRTYFINAVLSCSPPVAQAHARLPITTDSLPGF